MLHPSSILNLLSDDISYQSSKPLDSACLCLGSEAPENV